MPSQSSERMVCTFLWLVVVPACLAAGIAASGRTETDRAPRAQKKRKPADSSFTCPDSGATEACKYFESLREAHDENVSRLHGASSYEYACFRDRSDEFFIVHLSGPSIHTETSEDSQTQQPGYDAKSSGWGEINTFSRGVKDRTLAPQLEFKGTWLGSHYFVANEINGQGVSGSVGGEISVDPQQFNVAWRYKSPSGAVVDYRLAIQQSTGRFSETFAKYPSRLPSLARHGSCSPLPNPLLPDTN